MLHRQKSQSQPLRSRLQNRRPRSPLLPSRRSPKLPQKKRNPQRPSLSLKRRQLLKRWPLPRTRRSQRRRSRESNPKPKLRPNLLRQNQTQANRHQNQGRNQLHQDRETTRSSPKKRLQHRVRDLAVVAHGPVITRSPHSKACVKINAVAVHVLLQVAARQNLGLVRVHQNLASNQAASLHRLHGVRVHGHHRP